MTNVAHLDPSASSAARVDLTATSLRDALLEIARQVPGEAMGEELLAAIEGAEDAPGPHLVVELSAALGADPGDAAAAAAALALLEAAQRLEGSVHGLTESHRDPGDDDGGNDAAALASAWARARSSELAAEIGPEAQLRHSRALADIADGWIREAEDLYDAGRTPERCIAAIGGTHGAAGSLAAALAALAAGLPEDRVDALASFGEAYAVAAKVCEDAAALVPALVASPGVAGSALARGVYSLPVAYALEEDASLARDLAGAVKEKDLDELIPRIREAGGIGRAAAYCRRRADEAVAAIEDVPGTGDLAELAGEVARRCEEAALA